MREITLDKKYLIKEDWADMTISEAQSFFVAFDSMPEKLKETYEAIMQKDEARQAELYGKWTDEEKIKLFPLFYGECLEILSNVPRETISRMFEEDRNRLYNRYCQKFVIGLLFGAAEHSGDMSFEFDGVRYHLPDTRDVLGKQRPMADASVIEFTEAADLRLNSKQLEAGLFDRAANIISILARPMANGKREAYNERTCLDRAEKFKELTMDHFWNVFFYLQELRIIYEQSLQVSLLEEAIREEKLLNG